MKVKLLMKVKLRREMVCRCGWWMKLRGGGGKRKRTEEGLDGLSREELAELLVLETEVSEARGGYASGEGMTENEGGYVACRRWWERWAGNRGVCHSFIHVSCVLVRHTPHSFLDRNSR
jgi:hypothetical protein